MQPTQNTQNPSASNGAPSGAKKWGIIAGGLIAVAVVVVAGWLAWNAFNTRSQEETPAGKVSITADGFSPASIKVKKGTDVVWTNQDVQPRSVQGDQEGLELATPEALDQGETYSYIFDTPGTYTYHDPAKPDHKATVIVE